MKKFYVLTQDIDPDFRLELGLPLGLHWDERAIRKGQSQYINDEEEVLPIQRRSGVLSDIYRHEIPLISDKLKDIFDDANVYNIFYKPVYLEEGDMYYAYFVPIVRPIICVDRKKSGFNAEGPNVLKRITGGFSIVNEKVGNFKIFKVKDAINDLWIIDQDLKERIDGADMVGIKMIETLFYQG